MQNQGYTGFLIEKTVQKVSLRTDTHNSDFEDYKKRNILTYIHKKVQNTRERLGIKTRTAQLSSGVNFLVRKAIKSTEPEQIIDIPKEEADLLKMTRIIFNNLRYENEYVDDFCVETKGQDNIKRRFKSKQSREDTEKKLTQLINQGISEEDLLELFTSYRREKLKDKIKDFQTQNKMDFAKIQEKLQMSQKQEEDPDQVQFLMTEVTNPSQRYPKGYSIGQVLNINDQDIEYKSKKIEEVEREQRRQARLAKEQLNDLMKVEEENQQKGMIRIFKETQLDNMDGDAAKHKYKMVNFKKKQEIQEKLFQEMANHEKNVLHDALQNKDFEDSNRFVRPRKTGFKGPKQISDVFSRLSTTTMKTEAQQTLQTEGNAQHEGFFNQNELAQKMAKVKSQISPAYNLTQSRKTDSSIETALKNYMTQSKNGVNNSHRPVSQHIKSNGTFNITIPKQTKQDRCETVTSDIGVKPFHSHRPTSAASHTYTMTHGNTTTASLRNSFGSLPSHRIDTGNTNLNQNTLASSKSARMQNSHKISFHQSQLSSPRLNISCLQSPRCKSNDRQKTVADLNEFQSNSKAISKEYENQSKSIKNQFGIMENAIGSLFDKIEKTDFEKPIHEQRFGQEETSNGDKFSEYTSERNFKRKLISFLIDKVEKKSDVLSKFNGKKWTKEMLAQIESSQQQAQQKLNEKQSQFEM